MKDEKTQAAEWLLLGFTKCWTVKQICGSMKLSDEWWTPDGAAALHQRIPFLPFYAVRYQSPLRAYIASEWPKLSQYLTEHEKEPVKLLSIVPQIIRLKSKAVRSYVFTSSERKELYKSEEAMRRVETANRAARRQQLSTQRGAWNVCK